MTCKGDGVDEIWDGEEWQKVACAGCGACKPTLHPDGSFIENDEYFAQGAANIAAALNDSIDFHTRSLQRMAELMEKQNVKPNRKDRRRWRRKNV